MAITYQKTKSVAKQIITKGPRLDKLVLSTMAQISEVVGCTLGPGGQPVLLERFEHDLPPTVTKDGVSVMRTLGMDNASAQCIMECARDAAVRTVSEAGDGTTTATVLSEAIVRHMYKYREKHPEVSPQKIMRRLERVFREVLEPTIIGALTKKGKRKGGLAVKVKSETKRGAKLLKSVARVSANGDDELASAVMECFDQVGDDGNVTINEMSGPSGYIVKTIDGFPIGIGYEECCANLYPKFINQPATQKTVMENPIFVIYFGQINDIQTAWPMLVKIGDEFELYKQHKSEWDKFNVILCATGFSSSVLGVLAANFGNADSIKVYPLVAPKTPFLNGQLEFMRDLAAITGAKVFDPINNSLDRGTLEDVGPGLELFEATRFRSTVVGRADEDLIIERAAELEAQKASSDISELDRNYIEQRIGKLTGGIASLTVVGASNGELKEKKDRAEDAVCSVRGAIRHGVLPGGAWTMLRLIYELEQRGQYEDPVVSEVLCPALKEPFDRLLLNCGMSTTEIENVWARIMLQIAADETLVYDALEHKFGDAFEMGILDAVPAVLEAIRNSISIASLLGTLGGTVCFKRDHELELREAESVADWMRQANSDTNEANERI